MAKDSEYWFKRRRYGWGWFPVTWQGWLVVIVYLLLIFLSARAFTRAPQESADFEMYMFILILALATITLIRIGYVKGPRPRWRWGKTPGDNPKEDF